MGDILDQIIGAISDGLWSIFNHWPLIIIQLLATVVLFVIIRIFLWKPITKYLTARQEALTKELEEARAEKERLNQIKQDTLKEYESVRNEARTLRESILKEAQSEKERIITEARTEAKRRISQVEHDIQQEIRDQNNKIRETIKEVAFAAAKKVVQQEVNEEVHDEMINELIDERL